MAAQARPLSLARRLADAGLTQTSVLRCLGVNTLAAVALVARERQRPAALTLAARLPWLLVGGASLGDEEWKALPTTVRLPLESHGWVAREGDAVAATATLLPVGDGLCVAARTSPLPARFKTAPRHPRVTFPDDSAHHLIGALPRALANSATDTWLDIGAGSGIAQLARPDLADRKLGADLDRDALAAAADGALLSGNSATFVYSDLFDALPTGLAPALITFNAPIPAARLGLAARAPAADRYRLTGCGDELLQRFWRDALARLAPGGEILCHSVQGGAVPAPDDLPGRVVQVTYTPADATLPFAVTSCVPAADRRVYRVAAPLTASVPHLVRRIFEAPESALA